MPRKMKDSGVGWIGQIPEKWNLSRIKYLVDFEPICDFTGLNEESVVTYTPMENIKQGYYIPNAARLGDLSTSLTHYEEGDIVLAKVTPCFENGNIAIMCGLESGVGLGSSELFVFRCRNIDAKYFFYWLQNPAFMARACSTMTGTGGLKRVSPTFVKNCEVHCPPADIQLRIATFLDHECSHIDSIIEKTRSSIEEYKKLKQSIITQAVTKGIRPGRKMKDSGIEWIGEIPEEWETIKIKWVLKERNERSMDGSEEPLSMSQKYGLIPTKEMDMVPNMAATFVGAKKCYEEDLVFNKLKAHLGVFAVSKYNGLVSPDYAVYYSTGTVNVKYMEYLFKTPEYINEFKKRATGIGAGLTRLYTGDLFSIIFAAPSLDEQDKIVKFVDEKVAYLDLLIGQKDQLINELNDYKKSIIYEYITGKREVSA